MTNLPRLTKLKVQKAAPMIVDHVKELLADIDVENTKQFTVKVKTMQNLTLMKRRSFGGINLVLH